MGVFTTLACLPTFAQSSTLYWVRYYNQLQINKDWSWQNEVDERRSIHPDHQRQFIFHSYASFKVTSKTDLAAGVTGSWVTNSKNLTVPELRLFQSVTTKLGTFAGNDVQFRFRLEERFFRNTNVEKTMLTDGFHFKLRSRYRIQFQRSFNNQTWIVRLADEIMYHTDGDDLWKFDQNRLYAGLERKLTRKLSLEMGYMLLHALSNDKIMHSNNVRTTLYHRISL